MSDKSVDVRSVQQLEHLCAAIGQFAERFEMHVSSLQTECMSARDHVVRRRAALGNRVEMLEQMLAEAAADDDTSDIAASLDDARDLFDKALDWEVRVQQAEGRYRVQLVKMNSMLHSSIPTAKAVLTSKIDQLYEILAVRPKNFAAAGPRNAGGVASVVPAGRTAATSIDSCQTAELRPYTPFMQFYTLPKGFRWVRLNEVLPEELDRARNIPESPKISFGDIGKGFAILQREILPALMNMQSGSAYEYFIKQDADAPRPDGLFRHNVFAAFFGRHAPEYIRLSKRSTDSGYSVVNGYHRIRVALDLGWEAIPAEAVEVV